MSAPGCDNALREQGAIGTANNTSQNPSLIKSKPQGKQDTILSVLKSGTSLNRFEAERIGDHSLNSTIAALRAKGHPIHDEWEKVPTRFGKGAHVKRYAYTGCGHGEV